MEKPTAADHDTRPSSGEDLYDPDAGLTDEQRAAEVCVLPEHLVRETDIE